jgi:hypothetical protein
MITSLLLLAELVLVALLVWRLGRKLKPGEPRTLGLLAYTQGRYESTQHKERHGA